MPTTDWKSAVVWIVAAIVAGAVLGYAIGALLKVWWELAWMAVR